MMPGLVRVMVCGAALALVQQAQPVLRLLEPTGDTVVAGPTTFRVSVPAGVKQVVYQVDGVEACRATAPPFSCEWDAGARLASRVVRAVATMQDGTIVRVAVQTKGIAVTETTSVDLVLVPARVTDDRGRFVPGLTAADFVVLEDGKLQEISVLESGDGTAELLLALDISGSMAPVIADLKATVRDFLRALRPDDKVTLAAFNTGLFVLARRDVTRDAQIAALERLRPWGGTAIFDTIIRGVEMLKLQPGRRALVVFSDGDDVASQSSLETSRTDLQSNDVVLYLIATGKAASDGDLKRRLTDLAIETGGGAYFSDRLSGTAEHFQQIARELGQQYLLAFSPTRPLGDGKWRALSVKTSNRRHVVRARTGYIASRRGQGGR